MEYNLLVVNGIILIRIFLPLLILRFPFVGIITMLLIDAGDQTFLQKFTTADLTSYQSFDKALDIYYLAVAYIVSARLWKNIFASQVAAFLFFYRLIGFFLFEITGNRYLLFIFPNTFEYFFIFYVAYSLKRDTALLTKKHILLVTGFIWVFIKLPQEYIIHIAQVDVTDWIRSKF